MPLHGVVFAFLYFVGFVLLLFMYALWVYCAQERYAPHRAGSTHLRICYVQYKITVYKYRVSHVNTYVSLYANEFRDVHATCYTTLIGKVCVNSIYTILFYVQYIYKLLQTYSRSRIALITCMGQVCYFHCCLQLYDYT